MSQCQKKQTSRRHLGYFCFMSWFCKNLLKLQHCNVRWQYADFFDDKTQACLNSNITAKPRLFRKRGIFLVYGKQYGACSVSCRNLIHTLSYPSSHHAYLTSPYPYLPKPHHTLPYLTSPHLTSPHLTSPHLTLPPSNEPTKHMLSRLFKASYE